MELTLPTKINISQLNHFVLQLLTYKKSSFIKHPISFQQCYHVKKIVIFDPEYYKQISNSESLRIEDIILSKKDFTNQNFHYTPFNINFKQHRKYKLVFMDTEMVKTRKGFEIAQISVIDNKNRILLNQFCKPKHKVIDYLTKYSGVTKKLLKNQQSYQETKNRLLYLLQKHHYIVCGHGLDNDFKVLKIQPALVIDTAQIFGQRKQKLQFLSRQILNREIQNESHDALEDCHAVKDIVESILNAGSSEKLTQQGQKVRDVYGIGQKFIDVIKKNNIKITYGNLEQVTNDYQKELIICSSQQQYQQIQQKLQFSQSIYFTFQVDRYICEWK